MHIILERSHFLKSLNHLHRIVERRNAIPILANVLLQAQGVGLTLKTTDLDIEMTETIDAKIQKSGQTTAPAHLLYDIVRKFSEGSEVMMVLNDSQTTLSISSGTANFQIQCLPENDFPQLAPDSFQNNFQISSLSLKTLIDKIQFAISTEETRHYLNGIYLHIYKSDNETFQLRAVATDGHRLARTEFHAPENAYTMPSVIVPRKTVNEVQRLIDTSDSPITIELSETKIRFTLDNIVLTSRLINGSFPDYQRVIPTGNDKILLIDRQNFTSAVDRVSTISSDKGHGIKLVLSKNQITLHANNTDSSSAVETLSAEYDSDTLEIGFNARYLLDALGQVESNQVRFMLSDSGSPCTIEDTDDSKTLYVLMPMRI